MLIAGSAPVDDPLAAEEGEVTLHSRFDRAATKVTELLPVTLAIHDIFMQSDPVEHGPDLWHAFERDRGHDRIAAWAVEGLAQPT